MPLLALVACAGGALGPSNAPDESSALPERAHYELTFSDDLRKLDARVCFEGPTPRTLRTGKNDAGSRLQYARWLSPGAVRRLPVQGGRVLLGTASSDGCVSYGIDLTEGGGLSAMIKRAGASILASPNAWLLRPERYAPHFAASVQVKGLHRDQVSLPWPADPQAGDRYQFHADSFRFDTHAAFGSLRRARGSYAGVDYDVSLLGNALHLPESELEAWMHAAIDTAQHGPFGVPCQRLHVIVVPDGSSDDGVSFGSVTRGGTNSVLLFVGGGTTLDGLRCDWVLPHELSHLFLPFLPKAHAWFSEGAATYYQEVLRARSGVITMQRALQNMADAMGEVAEQAQTRSLREESARMHESKAFRTVYWGGAAFFLMADVALRERSQGKLSLDHALRALHARHSQTPDYADVDTLLADLDQLTGSDIFMQLAKDALVRPFPDVEPLLERLAARAKGEAFERAELAQLRSELFGAHANP